jgi:hypothetical protein
MAIYEAEVVTNPTLGIEQIIWSDIPMTIQGSSQFDRSFNPPVRPWPTIPAHQHGLKLGIHGIQLEVLEEDVTLK